MKPRSLATGAVAALAAIALTACSGGSSGGAANGASVASNMIFGAGPEFKNRAEGIPGLKATYGITFSSFKPLDAGGPLTVNALKNGQIDAGNIFTTDPSITADNFVVLQDPKNLFLAQNVVPLIAKSKATPIATKVLDAVSAKLTTADLIQLNEQVISEKKDPNTVAMAWLNSHGLGNPGTEASSVRLTVGSANFQESVILAYVYADALTAQGATVTTKLNIGSRETYIPGLEQGSIDFVPEYSGVLLQYFDKQATADTPDGVFTALQKALPADLTVAQSSAAEDKDAIVVTAATAKKYHLTTIADLAKMP